MPHLQRARQRGSARRRSVPAGVSTLDSVVPDRSTSPELAAARVGAHLSVTEELKQQRKRQRANARAHATSRSCPTYTQTNDKATGRRRAGLKFVRQPRRARCDEASSRTAYSFSCDFILLGAVSSNPPSPARLLPVTLLAPDRCPANMDADVSH